MHKDLSKIFRGCLKDWMKTARRIRSWSAACPRPCCHGRRAKGTSAPTVLPYKPTEESWSRTRIIATLPLPLPLLLLPLLLLRLLLRSAAATATTSSTSNSPTNFTALLLTITTYTLILLSQRVIRLFPLLLLLLLCFPLRVQFVDPFFELVLPLVRQGLADGLAVWAHPGLHFWHSVTAAPHQKVRCFFFFSWRIPIGLVWCILAISVRIQCCILRNLHELWDEQLSCAGRFDRQWFKVELSVPPIMNGQSCRRSLPPGHKFLACD